MTGMAIAVKVLAEAVLDQLRWAMGSGVGILLEHFLVEMGVSMGGMVGVACGILGGTL